LGLGYKPETDKAASTYKASQVNKKIDMIPNRSVAVDALKSGMMARFKNSFVAASSGGSATGSTMFTSSPGQQVGQNASQTRSSGGIGYGNGKGQQTLSGFVSGGSIGIPQNQAKGNAGSNAYDAGYVFAILLCFIAIVIHYDYSHSMIDLVCELFLQ
jgi:hypothetical protein